MADADIEIDYGRLADAIVKRLPVHYYGYPVWVDPRYYHPWRDQPYYQQWFTRTAPGPASEQS